MSELFFILVELSVGERKMNKTELIASVAQKSGLSKADAAKALDAITGTIINTLSANDSVIITGFGSFVVRDRAARTGRNPQTGMEIQIKASKVPAFKAGKLLKDSVNR